MYFNPCSNYKTKLILFLTLSCKIFGFFIDTGDINFILYILAYINSVIIGKSIPKYWQINVVYTISNICAQKIDY